MNRKYPIFILLGFILSFVSQSCKDNDDDTYYAELTNSSTAITAFSLQENNEIMENLDSVFFTIDLDNAQIYNADSLPVGTDVSKLKVSMTFATCYSAEFHVTGGKVMSDTTFAYSERDTIDFTGDVKFTILSQDLSSKREYSIKVNVHNIEPDTLYWDRMARRNLPTYSDMDVPIAQKTVQYGTDLYCMMKVGDSYTLAISSNPESARWERKIAEFSFEPDLNTFTATDNALYMLGADKKLYTSVDGVIWTSCDVEMYSISGSFGERLLGVIEENGVYKHTEYPMSEGFVPYEVDRDFPIYDVSPMITLSSKWAVDDQRVMIGGVTSSGAYTGMMWGYDGTTWGKISRKGLPAIKGAALFAYYYSYFNAETWVTSVTPVLVAVGGVKEGNKTMNNVVYISGDKGVTWNVASATMQMPDYISEFANAQAFVYNSTLTDARSGVTGWIDMPATKLPASMRYSSRAVEPITSWECPYVYLFGGTNINGTLYNNIWRGVINRLAFKPLY